MADWAKASKEDCEMCPDFAFEVLFGSTESSRTLRDSSKSWSYFLLSRISKPAFFFTLAKVLWEVSATFFEEEKSGAIATKPEFFKKKFGCLNL